MANDKLIYHYTSFDAFLNIIKTKCFWATNIYFTSDFMEVNLGINRHQFAINNSKIENADLFYEEFLKLLEPFRLPTREIYFLSFSKNQNDLSQWRAYAKKGVCIGIDSSLFETESPSDCVYDDEEQLNKLQDIVKIYSKFVENPEIFDHDEYVGYEYKEEALNMFKTVIQEKLPFHCAKYSQERVTNLYHKIQTDLWGFFILAKNKNFKIENETRFLYNPNINQVEFRVFNNLLVPYCKIEFDLSSVKEVWVDTELENFELMEYSIRNLWKKETNFKITTPRIIPAHLSLR